MSEGKTKEKEKDEMNKIKKRSKSHKQISIKINEQKFCACV